LRRFRDIREGAFMILEWRLKRKDGAVCWVRTSARPVFRDGIFYGIRGTITDISDRRRAEIALQEAHRKLQLLNSAIRHNIRTQFLALSVFLSELQASLTNPRHREYACKSIESVKSVAKQIEFTREYQTLGEGVCRLAEDHEVSSGKNVLGIVVASEIAHLEIFADPMARTVFSSLYDNAI
jgi:hypothetical protein